MMEKSLIEELREAQNYTNFVILMPMLSDEYMIQNISLRKESKDERSSIRFEIKNNGRVLRIKQFFYDWAIPVITADTNLVSQGKSFNVDGIVGFIGIDYKGNQAACYSKWFTNIELSVLEGAFEENEIISIFKSLKAVDKNYIAKLGQQSFTTCSYTARFKKSKWANEDEISRVTWYEATEIVPIEESLKLGIALPALHNHYFLDSIGFKSYDFGNEFHFLYRSKRNYTDGFWLWIAPRSISDPLPIITGHRVGKRQSWNVWKVKGTLLTIPVTEVFLCRQNSANPGWMLHWEKENTIYHLYIRPSADFSLKNIHAFLSVLYS
jgi:hypothetical protein